MSLEAFFQVGSVLVGILIAFAISSVSAKLVGRSMVKPPQVHQTRRASTPVTTVAPAASGVDPQPSDGSPAAPAAPRPIVRWHSHEIPRPRFPARERPKV